MAFQNYIFLFFLAVLRFKSVQCAEFVPVFMWGTEKTTDLVPALHKISEDSFKDTLLEYLKKNPYVVVFAERTLSPEDFAHRNVKGESPYNNLPQLQDKGNFISYRPAVQNPIGAIRQVKPVTHTSIGTILSNIDVPKENIWIINLDDAKDEESRFHMLKRHDTDIVSIYNDIRQKQGNVLAIYTANHTSWVAPSNANHKKLRKLLQNEEKDEAQNFKDSNCLLYISKTGTLNSNITVDQEKWSLKFDNVTATLTQKDDNNIIQFNITENKNTRYWFVDSIEVNGVPLNGVKDIYAPVGFSYHCGSFNLKGAEKDKVVSLDLPGFQFQVFGPNDTFGDAYDCVGFTSVPIWSGIFVTAILLLIVTFGLIMMMDIKTMDRFDDPKGKTITVNVSE